MKNLFRFLGIFCAMLTMACEDPIDLDIPSGAPRIVVDGQLTIEPFVIKLSLTTNFNDTSANPVLSGARVVVEQFGGPSYIFEEKEPGIYHSPAHWSALIGQRYRCMITTQTGKRVESSYEMLQAVPNIDSLYVTQRLPVAIIDGVLTPQFILNASITDPPSIENYYRWQLSVNGQLLLEPVNLILFSDKFVDGTQFNYQYKQRFFLEGDTVSLTQFSMSRDAFNYYNLLYIQATRLGQATGTAPARLRGNLRNPFDPDEIILGYFRAKDLVRKKIIIKSNK